VLGFGLARGFGDGLAVGFGLGEGRIEGEGDGRSEGEGDGSACVAVGLGDARPTRGRVSLLLDDPGADSAEPTMTAAISSALNPPPPMSKPVVQGDRAPIRPLGMVGIQAAPVQRAFPSGERVESQFLPSQYQLPSGET